MALIHISATRNRTTWCGRRTHNSTSKADFIAGYTKDNGNGYCSKCASSLITRGELVKADATVPQDLQIIIDAIKAVTEDLKLIYLDNVRKFAENKFAEIAAEYAWSDEAWYLSFKIKTEMKYSLNGVGVPAGTPGATARLGVHESEYHGRKLYKMRARRDEVSRIVNAGYDVFLAKKLKEANEHYEYSTEKLANRVKEKSINVSVMKITRGYVGVNLEVVISDGINTVKAWTIVAALDSVLVTPHYRYLVK